MEVYAISLNFNVFFQPHNMLINEYESNSVYEMHAR